MTVDRRGLLLCSRYAFAPNYFHYCGPERQRDLLGYVTEGITDRGLPEILDRFETLYPYLQLIAGANHIKDPFDTRVVEAYWLGNPLLSKVPTRVFADHIADTLGVKKKVMRKHYVPMMDRVVRGVPQHTFHVLNIFVRTGHHAAPQTLQTMDACRISLGRVTGTDPTGAYYLIKSRPLAFTSDLLCLGEPVTKSVLSVGLTPKKGDWVSVHWGYVCAVLTDRQRTLLTRFTTMAIDSANKHL